ncbi:MAG: type 1 glutamine amidotransferase [Coriobacteriales bacterium]
MSELRICHLYPDVLNLYGDRGNTITLQQRCLWRGIEASVTGVGVGERADLGEFDLFFIGGGQDFDQGTLLGDLWAGGEDSKARQLARLIEQDAPVLAICGGYQLLGEYYLTHTGSECRFIGAIPFHTKGASQRMIGNLLFTAGAIPGAPQVVGFENHSGKTHLDAALTPLGTVDRGFGNNGEDGTEGLRYRNVVATYSHGPLLPKNPAVADELLRLALERREGAPVELAPLDDALEMRAHDTMAARLR